MNKKGQRELILDDSIPNANDMKISKNKENSLERKEFVITHPPAILEPEVCAQNEDVCSARPEVNPLEDCLRSLDPMQAADIISRPDTKPVGDLEESLNSAPVDVSVCKLISDIQPHDTSVEASTTMNAVLSDSVLNKHKAVTGLFAEKPNISKSHSLTNSSHSRGTINRGRSSVKNMVSVKPKTFAAGVGSGHFEGVEAKLNELLEIGGGISKQKDATRGYLKLLFVTAAEGDVGGRASQSTRDLSLILDAILKTKSRKVLVDIINKNGLQMLHNIMKQNRGILTPELIKKDPPHNGMESFKESILKLANHSDKQVHKIAREFRDKWIPRNIKRIEPSDRDSVQLDRKTPLHRCIQSTTLEMDAARDTDAIVIVGTASVSCSELDNKLASGTKARKRKSRWDHPSDTTMVEEPGPKFSKCSPDCDDGRPPGFEKNHHSEITGEECVMGHPQEIYLSHMAVSYGIPVALMQQFGEIVPGIPFHPFPPLPPYPRKDTVETSTGSRNSVFGGRRLRFPNNRGRGARFVHPQRWDNGNIINNNNKRRRVESCWPRGRLGRGGFGGSNSIRNGIRNFRGDFGQDLCPSDGVNNNYANSGYQQPHR